MDSNQLTYSQDSLLEHAAWMRRLALELVRDPGAADDLAQETWLAFHRARPATDRPLRPWLARVMRNAAALRVRRGAGRESREREVARSEDVPSSHELAERAEEQRRLAALVLDLDEPYRSTVLLRYYEGLKPTEIARLRGMPAATVRTHLQRGLSQLRERLDEEHDGDRRAWLLLFQPLLEEPGRLAALAGAGPLLVGGALVLAAGLAVAFALFGQEEKINADGSLVRGSLEVAQTNDGLGGFAADDGSRVPIQDHAAQGVLPEGRLVRVVERGSGRALPGYGLRANGRIWRTDGEGRVRLPVGVGEVELVDDVRLSQESFGVHGSGVQPTRTSMALEDALESTLALPVGPTLEIELRSPGGFEPERLEAHLWAARSRAAADGNLPGLVAPLRPPAYEFDSTWARFGPLPPQLAELGEDFRLDVRELSGTWLGSVAVALPTGGDVLRVSLDLQSVGVVEGRVLAVEPGEDAMVALRRPGTSTAIYLCALGPEHEFTLSWVEPGTYELFVQTSSHAPWSEQLEVRGGERIWREPQLEALEGVGDITGEITSESGTYDGQLLVFLLDAEGRSLDVYPTTWLTGDDGKLVANFEFIRAPHGALSVDVVSLADAVTTRIAPANFVAPCGEVTVCLLDRRPAADWSFDVVDSTTGEALERFEVEVRVDGGKPRTYKREMGEGAAEPAWTLIAGDLRWNRVEAWAPLRRLPDGVELHWTVRAEGYGPEEGDESTFEVLEGGRRLARVRLTAGSKSPDR
jgi:RNA polymerase sigma-70 factor (ECF subfamily)